MVLEPLDLIARICALIPAPRVNMIRYHGVLSSHSSLRKEVVPLPPAAVANPLLEEGVQLALEFEGGEMGVGSGGCGDGADEVPLAKRRPWAWLLRYVWEVDVSSCARCGGPMKWVEVAREPEAIARVLGEVGLADVGGEVPVRARRRRGSGPVEQLRFGFG